MFLVFDRGLFELVRGSREKMEWFGDRHGGDLRTDLRGEKNALLDGFGGEIRSIGWDQDVLEQMVVLPGSVFTARRWSRRIPSPQER